MRVRPRRWAPWAWGWAAGGLLAAVALASVALGVVGGIPLFDGLAPPAAYRWVKPPPELRSGNKAPAGTVAPVALGPSGSTAVTVSTPDDQVLVSLAAGAFPPSAGQTGLQVSVEPLDPAPLPPPPAGIAVQGNAYRVVVSYVPSGTTATASQPVDVTLRYPVDATKVILLAGAASEPAWKVLPTTLESASLAVDATTSQLGVMAAAGQSPASSPRRTPGWVYVAAAAALVVAGIPTLLGRGRRR
jgi:hypothetical protein